MEAKDKIMLGEYCLSSEMITGDLENGVPFDIWSGDEYPGDAAFWN